MLSLEQIKHELQDLRISKVAEVTGLSTQTLYKIRDGLSNNPSYHTMTVLSGYLEDRKEAIEKL